MERTLDILDRLIAFPTVSRDRNLDLIAYVRDLLVTAGFQITDLPSPDGRKAGLFARIGPGTDRGLCLSAHTDVVPVDGQDWSRPVFKLTRDGDRLFGRGTTDMKGFLASALAMAERAATSDLTQPLSLSISYDEEIGCVGIRQMMPGLAPVIGTPRLVIVGEPTSMRVATGHKGKAALRVACRGQAGHSALAPNFVNAIHVAAQFVGEMTTLQGDLAQAEQDAAYAVPYSTVHIGKIQGGRALNIVPDSAVLDVEYRHLPALPSAHLGALIDQAAAKVSAQFPGVAPISVEEVNAYPGLEADLAGDGAQWAIALSPASETTKVAFGTEAGFFADLGLDTIVMGPGDMSADGHKPDEGLDLSELAACDAMLDRALTDLCA